MEEAPLMATLERHELLARLTAARAPIAGEIADALRSDELVGVVGDAGVGKSTLVDHVLGQPGTIKVDLNLAASYEQLAHQWALSIASKTMEATVIKELAYYEPEHWSLATHRELAVFAEDAGGDVAEHLTRPNRERRKLDHREMLSALVRATARVYGTRDSVLLLDHLEAPGLSFRHPVDVAELLWQVRAITQYGDALRVVLVCRPPAVDLAVDSSSAFYGEGRWITVARPTAQQFATASGQPLAVVEEILRFTHGHVTATIDVLMRVNGRRKIFGIVQEVAREQRDLARRTIEYARSVNRLGGHLLDAVAHGYGPYRAAPAERGNAVATAMKQLHRAGLVSQPEEGRWLIVDPRVEWWITGSVITPSPTGLTAHVFNDDISGVLPAEI